MLHGDISMDGNFWMKTPQDSWNGITDVANVISEGLSIYIGLLIFTLHFKKWAQIQETILK